MFPNAPNVFNFCLVLVETLGAHYCIVCTLTLCKEKRIFFLSKSLQSRRINRSKKKLQKNRNDL